MAQQTLDQTGQERSDYAMEKINANFTDVYAQLVALQSALGSNKITSQGTFIANGASAVTVADTSITANSQVLISLNTVGGTVGAIPAVKTKTAATGFTVAGTASDTSTYSYTVLN